MGQETSGRNQQTQTQTPDPITDQWRNQVFNQGNTLINSPLPQQTFSDATQQGFGQLQTGANAVGQSAQGAQGALGAIANGRNPFGGQTTTAGVDVLRSFNGAPDNPFLRSLYNQGAEAVTDDVNAQFSKAGRYGPSAAYGAGLSKGLGNLYSSIYAPAYESAQDRALQAGGQLAGIQQNDFTRNASIYNQDIGNRLAATSQLPSIWEGMMLPGQTQLGIGQAQDEQNFSNANAPWEYLSMYGNMMNGMPTFGTTTSSGTSNQSQRGMNIGWGPNGFSFGLGGG